MSDTPLRIMQVLRAPTGGLWRHVADLTIELARRGHDVGLIIDAGFSDAQTESRLAIMEKSLSLGLHKVPISRQPGPGDFSAIRTIRKIADAQNVQVLHGHGAKGGLYARLARWGRPSSISGYTTHGGVLNYENKSLMGRSFRHVERALLKLTDIVFFESGYAQTCFFEQIGQPNGLSPVVHNGLRAEEFKRIEKVANPHDFSFLGEIRKVKGMTYLLQALTAIKAPDGRPATLYIVGDGPDMPLARQQVIELGLQDRVHFAGIQPAPNAFANGRCLVVPSLSESLPYVVLEAVAAEIPILTNRVGGMAEIYGPTAEHLLPAADVPALATAMQSFMNSDKAAMTEMEERLSFVRDRFSLERMTDGIESAYRIALSARTD